MNTENEQIEPTQHEQENVGQDKQLLRITGEISEQLKVAAKWAGFLAILGFIFVGLLVLGGFSMGTVMSFMPWGDLGVMPFPPFLFGIIYIVIAVIYFFPVLYLYRFSSGIKQALAIEDQDKLTRAFYNLKAHYKFVGIMVIIGIVLYVIAIIVLVIAGIPGLSNLSGMPV